MQGEPVNPPAAVPVKESVTEPAGVETVPELDAGSVTVAVHTDPCPTRTVESHETVVVVGLRFTVSVAELLPAPAEFVALTVTLNEPDTL